MLRMRFWPFEICETQKISDHQRSAYHDGQADKSNIATSNMRLGDLDGGEDVNLRCHDCWADDICGGGGGLEERPILGIS